MKILTARNILREVFWETEKNRMMKNIMCIDLRIKILEDIVLDRLYWNI